MSEINLNTTPCLVSAKQGVSVYYKERFLYSKYDPEKLINQTIDSLEILPSSIILCCSPVLPYGLEKLEKKLPENCILFVCEFEKELHSFMSSTDSDFKKSFSDLKRTVFLSIEELYNLPNILTKKSFNFSDGHTIQLGGFFKRVLRVDFSAGIQFNSDLYNLLREHCINSIKTFWSNRVTLVKFGRKYSQNLFKNLHNLSNCTPISNFLKNVSKPIVIFGAGQSLTTHIDFFSSNRESFYILCADTALLPLIKHNIIPNGVFIEEAQNIISYAFLGTKKHSFHIFSGITALPFISKYFPSKNISYFTSLYCDCNFLSDLINQNILPAANPPFGSVGITGTYYALSFRKSIDVPVIYYGLDFAYSAGFTHTNGTIAHIQRLINNSRLSPVQNYNAAFNKTSIKLSEDNSVFSTPVLQNYKYLFDNLFDNTENFFNGNDLNEQKLLELKGQSLEKDLEASPAEVSAFTTGTALNGPNLLNVKNFLENERETLCYLRDLLTGKTELSPQEQEEKITQLVENREYLFLHFPDGYKFTYSQSFLNRIRTEIDFFLKFI